VGHWAKALLGALLIWHGSAGAGELSKVEVERLGQGYRVQIEMHTDAPPGRVIEVLSDLPGLSRLNQAVREVEVLEPSARGNQRVRTSTRLCVAFFCVTTHQVNEVIPVDSGHVRWVVEPQHSDFRRALADLQVSPAGRGSLVSIAVDLEPKFWVPPLIDVWLIERKMRQEAAATLTALEQLAAEHSTP
jgi:hypothetical protein